MGPGRAMYGLFRRWQRGGVWLVIWKLLQVCAHQHGHVVSGSRSDRPALE
ncbi:hypothetical protein [Nocardia vinacea]